MLQVSKLVPQGKGLAPVLINKLQYGPRAPNAAVTVGHDWNRHRNDVRNLTQLISNRDKWPRLLTWQVVDVAHAEVADLQQKSFFSFLLD